MRAPLLLTFLIERADGFLHPPFRMILTRDENPYTAQRFGIQSIPTMMVVHNGQIVDRWMGAMPEPVLRNKVSAHI